MSVVVISQPMYFPWVGLFEQVALADVFVHYDNVQLPRGRSFMTRVQIKTPTGPRWITTPVKRAAEQHIIDVRVDNSTDWRRKHLASLQHAYARCPHVDEALALAKDVLDAEPDSLCELNILGIERIAEYLGLATRFERASRYPSESSGTTKLLELCERFDAETYVTGRWALNYLDHGAFEDRAISVRYMDYRCVRYDQPHGPFTPYVSILDAIALLGRGARSLIQPRTADWKDLVDEHA